MSLKKVVTILLILSLFLLPVTYAALNTGLQAPNEFEHSIYWEKNDKADTYSLKADNNTRLDIEKYNDDLYDTLFKTDSELDYYVTPMEEDNILMGTDNFMHEGYVMEIIEYNGEKYIVNTYITQNPTNDQIKDTVKYLTDFNELNNVEPLSL